MAEFQIQCFQNEFLPQDGEVMHAVLTVSASETGAGKTPDRPMSGPSC